MIKGRFLLFVALSLVAHLALFGLAVVLGPEVASVPSAEAVRANDFQAFREALRQAASDGAVPARLANAMLGLSEEELAAAFRQAPVLDNRLSRQEKAGLYKTMAAEAMANFAEGTGEGSALDEPLGRIFRQPPGDPSDRSGKRL